MLFINKHIVVYLFTLYTINRLAMTTQERGHSNKSVKSAREKLELETSMMEQRLVSLRRQLESDRKKRELKNKVILCGTFLRHMRE